MIRDGDRHVLVCNLAFPRDQRVLGRILRQVKDMTWPSPSLNGQFSPANVVSRDDTPGLERWTAAVEAALDAFGSDTLQKVVLARRSTFTMDAPIDSVELLAELRRQTPHCFHFLLQPAKDAAFLGASPERLYERSDRHLYSEAVAGTRPRGANPSEEQALAAELLSSNKDRREHEFVRRSIIDSLGPISRSYRVDREPSVMKLAKHQHLLAAFESTLEAEVTDADIVQALHPDTSRGWISAHRGDDDDP